MITKIVTLTKLTTLLCLGIALGINQALAQGTRGPDINGDAISNVGTNAVPIKDIIQIRGACLSKIVDELISSVSAGKVRVLGFEDTTYGAANNPPFNASYFTTTTDAGCKFNVQSYHDLSIYADLSECPTAFPGIKTRKVNLIHSGKEADWKQPESATMASFSYNYSEAYKLDAFGNIISTTGFASDPKVIGGTEGELEFQGYSNIPTGIVIKGDPVFKYPALKFRECLQTGLSELAKYHP